MALNKRADPFQSSADFFIAANQRLGEASVRVFFLVTSASGVGKTSARKLIETEIAGEVAVCVGALLPTISNL